MEDRHHDSTTNAKKQLQPLTLGAFNNDLDLSSQGVSPKKDVHDHNPTNTRSESGNFDEDAGPNRQSIRTKPQRVPLKKSRYESSRPVIFDVTTKYGPPKLVIFDRIHFKCGHTSYNGTGDLPDEKHDATNRYRDRYWDSNGQMLLMSYCHFVICPTKGPFPFKALPAELRLKIYRLLLPEDRTRPIHLRTYTGKKDSDRMWDGYHYDDLIESPRCAQSIPTGLFSVDKALSGEILPLFRHEFYYRMDISASKISARGYLTKFSENLASHDVLATWQPFKLMHNYHLNIRSYTVEDNYKVNVHRSFEEGCERITEWLRLISDEIVANNTIKNLIITAPCRCADEEIYLNPGADPRIFALFAPLQRIHVSALVQFSLHENDTRGHGIRRPCSEPDCLGLADSLRTHIGSLEGKELSNREASWKSIKSMLHDEAKRRWKGCPGEGYRKTDGEGNIEWLWRALNGYRVWGCGRDPLSFDQVFKFELESFTRRAAERQKRVEKSRQGGAKVKTTEGDVDPGSEEKVGSEEEADSEEQASSDEESASEEESDSEENTASEEESD